jgi:hypothetical protein
MFVIDNIKIISFRICRYVYSQFQLQNFTLLATADMLFYILHKINLTEVVQFWRLCKM